MASSCPPPEMGIRNARLPHLCPPPPPSSLAEDAVGDLTESVEHVEINHTQASQNSHDEPKFWFEFDGKTEDDSSPLLCNSFQTLISVLEICGNWQEYGNLNKDPKDSRGRSTKSLISEHCHNMIRAIQKQYKINFITERELTAQVMPFEGESPVELSAPWKLTLVLLDILGQLKLSVDVQERNQPEAEKQIEVLSLSAKLNMAKAIELVVGFGVLQNLSEDLNLPALSSFSREFVEQLSESVRLTELARFYRLAYMMDVICFIIKCPLIEGRLQRVNLHLLAATLQVMSGPIARPIKHNEQPNKKKSRKELKEAMRFNFENRYYENVISIRKGVQECMQVYFMHYSYDPVVLAKYSPSQFTVRAKAKLIATLLAFGALPNPKWVKERASQHATRILINDPNGLHIYYLALSDNVRQSRAPVSSVDAFWRVAGTIGNFIQCVLSDMKNPEGRYEFVCCIAEQALRMIVSNSGLQVHAGLQTPNGEGSTSSTANVEGLDAEAKCLFSFGIYAAYYLTKANSKLVMERFWTVLFKEWLELPSSAENVLDLLEISQQFLSCRHMATRAGPAMGNSNGHIILLVGIWRIHFFTFLATRKYLNGPVQSMPAAEKLKLIDQKLGLILIDLFESIHATTNLRICDLLANMTYNLDADNNPCALTLQWKEETDEATNQSKVMLYIKPADDLMDISSKSRELYRIIEDGVKEVTTLLTSRAVSSELLPTIFKELLEDDFRRETDVCRIDPLMIVEPAQILEVFDLQSSSDCTRLTSILLLSSFEHNVELIIQNLGIDDGKKALNYLMLILRRVVLQAEESESRKVDFAFKDTLLSVLRTTQCVIDLLYASQAFETSTKLSNNSKPHVSWDGFAPLIPYLHRLKECKHSSLKDEYIQDAVNDLHIRIVTHCKGSDVQKPSEESQLPYYKALAESNDPAPYIQANGLLTLRRLLESKDALAVQNKTVIFAAFQSALEQDDSYVYLQAIRGLSAMGSTSTWASECLPKLISDYKRALFKRHRQHEEAYSSDTNRFVAVTKLGEAITKIMKELGPIAVKYRDHVFDATLCLMGDNDPLLRTSGLSTLAELCEILEIPFQAIVNHVWNIIEGLALDGDIQVRRAAFHLGTKSLRGIANMVERDGPSILLTSDNYAVFLKNASQKTKLWLANERDEQCRLHLQLAYDELERVYKTLVTIPETNVLEKKISIYGS